MVTTHGWGNHGEDDEERFFVTCWGVEAGQNTLNGIESMGKFWMTVTEGMYKASITLDRREAIYLRNALTAFIEKEREKPVDSI